MKPNLEPNQEECQEISNPYFVVYLSYFYPEDLKNKILAAIKSASFNTPTVDGYLAEIESRKINYQDLLEGICYERLRENKILVAKHCSVINVSGTFKNNGLFHSRSILHRIPASIKSIQLLAFSGYFIEAYSIGRFVLEQLSLALRIELLTTEESQKLGAQGCLGVWKDIDPMVGKVYGLLSEMAHVGHKRASLFVDADNEGTHTTIATSRDYVFDQTSLILWLSERYCYLCERLFPSEYTAPEYLSDDKKIKTGNPIDLLRNRYMADLDHLWKN
jgi:hypothetical protein